MVLILLFALAGAILGTILSGSCVIAIIFAFFGFMIGWIFAIVIGAFLPQKNVFEEEIELVALRKVSAEKCFLGTNGFSYFFYRRDGDKIRLCKIPVSLAVFCEEDGRTGLIKVYYRRFTKECYFIWGVPDVHRRYEIYVPKGSIFMSE